MFFYLVLLLTVVPAIELAVLIKVGQHIGVGNTLMIIILTGVAGAALARYQGFRTLSKINDNLNRGLMPTEEMLDGLMILVGGVALLTPGFITDFMGFLLLIPATRTMIKTAARSWIQYLVKTGQFSQSGFHQQTTYRSVDRFDKDDDVEDAEFR